MSRSRVGGLKVRQKSALSLLEKQYEAFKEAHKDKEAWTTTRNGRTILHKGRSYADECSRILKEIAILKSKLSKPIPNGRKRGKNTIVPIQSKRLV